MGDREGLVTEGKVRAGRPVQGLLDEVTARIVGSVSPRRIVLFGTAAKGEMGSDSDLDLLVVVPDGTHRRASAHAIYRALAGVGFATDVVVVTETDVREHAANPWLVVGRALAEGLELYRGPS